VGSVVVESAVAYNARRSPEDRRMTSSSGQGTAARTHSLAPEHLGEVQAGAALTIAILGVAIFIAGIGVVVGGLTAAGSFDPANPPPNSDTIGTWQTMAGFAMFAVGLALVGAALSLLAGASRPRIPTAVASVVLGIVSFAAGVMIVLRGPSDLILAISLFGLGLGLAGAGLLLLRPRR